MIWLMLTIAAWGAVHSWLASLGVKDRIRRGLGEVAWRSYRLAYNAFSLVSFAPIALLVRTLPDHVLYSIHGPLMYVMLVAQGLALICLFVGVLQTDAATFIGVRQILAGEAADRLVVDGLYRWVRHPLYFFGLALLWLAPRMTLNQLVTSASLTVYLFVGAFFEERKLLREFGSTYAEYRSRTPMIIPIRLHS